MLGHNPGLNFVCVSYSHDLAIKHARDCRAVMQSDWYRRIFPKTRIGRKQSAEGDFRTTAGGGRFSTSVGGTLTGRGGDIIVIDDPQKPDEAMSETARRTVIDWFGGTLSSRLNDRKRGKIVLVMQRLHEEDLAGHLLESSDAWALLSLPAIAETDDEIPLGNGRFKHRVVGEALHPEREDVKELETRKKEMGSLVFSAQYQQAPAPSEGNLIKRAWLHFYSTAPDKQLGDQIVQSWDTASKDNESNDWSVCVTALIRNRNVYILDVFRDRCDFPDLKMKIVEHALWWNTDTVLIEDAASGTYLLQQLKREELAGVPRPIGRKPQGNKIVRMSAASPRIAAREVHLPNSTPWLDVFMREILAFPNGRYDDQVDALSQLLNWMDDRWEGLDLIGVGGEVFILDDDVGWEPRI